MVQEEEILLVARAFREQQPRDPPPGPLPPQPIPPQPQPPPAAEGGEAGTPQPQYPESQPQRQLPRVRMALMIPVRRFPAVPFPITLRGLPDFLVPIARWK